MYMFLCEFTFLDESKLLCNMCSIPGNSNLTSNHALVFALMFVLPNLSSTLSVYPNIKLIPLQENSITYSIFYADS